MPVSIDKSVLSESQRGKSQTSSFSQSQEYRSQTTAHIGSSGQDSQASIGGRYDDLLASGRHMEIKDAITALNRTTSLLSQNLSIVQSTVINNTNKLEEVIKSVQEVRQTQEAYVAEVEALRQDAQGLQKAVEAVEQTRSDVKVTEECRGDESDEPLSPLSEGGISLTEYLNVKRMRIDRSVDAVMTGKYVRFPLTGILITHCFMVTMFLRLMQTRTSAPGRMPRSAARRAAAHHTLRHLHPPQ
jgi:hypothetical protein